MQQAPRIARELALLSMSSLSSSVERLSEPQLQDMVVAAVRTLTTEVHDILETAAAEVKRGSERLVTSELQAANNLQTSRSMLHEAVELTQTAINRLGMAMELPEFIQMTNQKEVKAYALQILSVVNVRKAEIDEIITQSMVDWQLHRLPRIDRDILRIAVAEISYLGTPDRVAINEAVELAKRYSGEDGHRFVNGVLRRVSDHIKGLISKG